MEKVIDAMESIKDYAKFEGHELKRFRLATYLNGSAELVETQCNNCDFRACFDPYTIPINPTLFLDREMNCKIEWSDDEKASFDKINSMFDEISKLTENVATMESLLDSNELAKALGISIIEIERKQYQRNHSAMLRYHLIHDLIINYLSYD